MRSRARVLGVVAFAGMWLAASCGDESEPSGNGGADGGALASDAVGAACGSDADCGGSGKCASTLTGGAVGQRLGTSQIAPSGYCTASCLMDGDCGEGAVCFGAFAALAQRGECRKACSNDAACGRAEYECAMQAMPVMVGETSYTLPSTCQPRVSPVAFTDQAGRACTEDGACGGGFCRTGDAYPGGYCSGACIADADCGAGGLCIKGGYGSGGTCAEGCSSDSDCARDASGYGCVTYGERKVCGAKADPLAAGVVGRACVADGDCSGGACATELSVPAVAAPGGYCSRLNCAGDDALCGSGGECITSMLGSRCYLGCTSDSDCRPEYACTLRGTGETAAKVCFPIATPDAGAPDAGAGAPDAG